VFLFLIIESSCCLFPYTALYSILLQITKGEQIFICGVKLTNTGIIMLIDFLLFIFFFRSWQDPNLQSSDFLFDFLYYKTSSSYFMLFWDSVKGIVSWEFVWGPFYDFIVYQ
jgi:hypothetical protein